MALDIDTTTIRHQVRDLGRQVEEIARVIRHASEPEPRRPAVPTVLLIAALGTLALAATAVMIWMFTMRPGGRMPTRRRQGLQELEEFPADDQTPGLTELNASDRPIGAARM